MARTARAKELTLLLGVAEAGRALGHDARRGLKHVPAGRARGLLRAAVHPAELVEDGAGLRLGDGRAARAAGGLGVSSELDPRDFLAAVSGFRGGRAVDAHGRVVRPEHHHDLRPVLIRPARVERVIRPDDPQADSAGSRPERHAGPIGLPALAICGLGGHGRDATNLDDLGIGLGEHRLDQRGHIDRPIHRRPRELQPARDFAHSDHVKQGRGELVGADRGPVEVDALHEREIDLGQRLPGHPEEADEGVGVEVRDLHGHLVDERTNPLVTARSRVSRVRTMVVEVADSVRQSGLNTARPGTPRRLRHKLNLHGIPFQELPARSDLPQSAAPQNCGKETNAVPFFQITKEIITFGKQSIF